MIFLKRLLFTIAVIPLLLSGCTSMLLVKSAWNGDNIVIDGNDQDWGDTMFYIQNAQLTAGVRNDDKYLYMVLKTTNRRQSFQIMGLGLTLWFDPSGGTGEKFGIHFPIGRMQGDEFTRQQQQGEDQGGNPSFVMRSPNELELLGVNENGPERMTITDLKGIQMQMRNTGDGLIYELKVPLHSSAQDPYAINPKGTAIGIGVIGGKFEQKFERRGGRRGLEGGEGMPGGEGGEGGEMPGGVEGGMGEGGGRRTFSGDQGEQRQPPKQIDFWLKVNLSRGPQQAPAID